MPDHNSHVTRRVVTEAHEVTITHADLTAGATTQAINLWTLPAGAKVIGSYVKHSEAFAGGSISAMTVSVGKSTGGATFYTAAFDVYQAVAATTFQDTDQRESPTTAADVVTANFTSTSDNVVNATAGSVLIRLTVEYLVAPV